MGAVTLQRKYNLPLLFLTLSIITQLLFLQVSGCCVVVWVLIIFLVFKLLLTFAVPIQCVEFCFLLFLRLLFQVCVLGGFPPFWRKEHNISTIFLCVFVFSSTERGQGIAGERMTEDQGIKSSTHRDGCALQGTV